MLSLLPLLRACCLLNTIGANNPQDDYLFYVPTIDAILCGKFNWLNFSDLAKLLSDTTLSSHVTVLPFLFILANAIFFHLDMRFDLFVALFVCLVKTCIIADVLCYRLSGWIKAITRSFILLFSFSLTQSGSMFFGMGNLLWQFALLGTALALWSIFRIEKRTKSVVVMFIGGLISTLSYSLGSGTWLACITAVLLRGKAIALPLIFCALGMAIDVLPNVGAVCPAPAVWQQEVSNPVLRHFLFLMNFVGRPLSNYIVLHGRIPMSETAGYVGLIGGLLLVASLCASRSLKARPAENLTYPCAVAAISMLVFALVMGGLIDFSRAYLNPSYACLSVFFWYGIFGLCGCTLENAKPDFARPWSSRPKARLLLSLTSSLCAVAILLFSLQSFWLTNRDLRDKHFYLDRRTAVSEFCLRNFKTAPTYGLRYLFGWPGEHYEQIEAMALPLLKHQLSCFGRDQTWRLQGDFVQPTVKVGFDERMGTNTVCWVKNSSCTQVRPFDDYEHLSLCLPGSAWLTWNIDVPAEVGWAELKTAICLAKIPPSMLVKDGVESEIALSVDGRREEILFRRRFLRPGQKEHVSISLTKYKGKKIQIAFRNKSDGFCFDDWSIFEHPRIDVHLSRPLPYEIHPDIRPVNTELSDQFPKLTSQDRILSLAEEGDWESKPGVRLTYATSDAEAVKYKGKLDLRVADYSQVIITGRAQDADAGDAQRTVRLRLFLSKDEKNFKDVSLPFLADHQFHSYGYDLKLLCCNAYSRITGIEIAPARVGGRTTSDGFAVESVRFARK